MSSRTQTRLLFLVACCAAGVVLIATVNLSCGPVTVTEACAQACPEVVALEDRIAELEDAVMTQPDGMVGIGTIVAHTAHLTGSTSIAQMRAAGFAVCDGTTPASQGIEDAVVTGATPDLTGQFLRGATTSGDFQEAATAVGGLTAVVTEEPHTHTQAPHAHNASGGAHSHGMGHTHGMEHTHISRISDSNGFCNPGAVPNSEGHLSNQTDWDRSSGSGCHYTTTGSRKTGAPLSGRTVTDGSSAANTASATPSITVANETAVNNAAATNVSVTLASAASETRPANMGVVWMIRVR